MRIRVDDSILFRLSADRDEGLDSLLHRFRSWVCAERTPTSVRTAPALPTVSAKLRENRRPRNLCQRTSTVRDFLDGADSAGDLAIALWKSSQHNGGFGQRRTRTNVTAAIQDRS
jgi:hypothetical protein